MNIRDSSALISLGFVVAKFGLWISELSGSCLTKVEECDN